MKMPSSTIEPAVIELAEAPDSQTTDEPTIPVVYQQLAPTDRGSGAWRVLIAGFFFEALLWGFPVCFGVFQEYYSHVPAFANQNVAIIGTVTQGLGYLGAPLGAAVTKRYPRYQRHMIVLGCVMCIVALGTGSLADNLGGLVATQGVLYATGFLLLYWPTLSMVNEWWVVRRGFAFGLIQAAAGIPHVSSAYNDYDVDEKTGASGAILPFVFQALLQRYGYKTTLQATAISMILLAGPLIPFCKPRLPASESAALANLDWSFRTNPLFWIYVLSTIIQGFGLFFPTVFLASYATDIGLSGTMGALALSVLSMAQFAGQVTFGYLSDKSVLSVTTLAIICSVMSSLAAFLLWGFGHSLALLLLFSIVFGFFGYGFACLRAAMAKQFTSDPTTLIALQSILISVTGLGNIAVGPISAALIHGKGSKWSYGVRRYEYVIYFTGSCMLGSAVVLVMPLARRLWK
jgi:hypothetical protein